MIIMCFKLGAEKDPNAEGHLINGSVSWPRQGYPTSIVKEDDIDDDATYDGGVYGVCVILCITPRGSKMLVVNRSHHCW